MPTSLTPHMPFPFGFCAFPEQLNDDEAAGVGDVEEGIMSVQTPLPAIGHRHGKNKKTRIEDVDDRGGGDAQEGGARGGRYGV